MKEFKSKSFSLFSAKRMTAILIAFLFILTSCSGTVIIPGLTEDVNPKTQIPNTVLPNTAGTADVTDIFKTITSTLSPTPVDSTTQPEEKRASILAVGDNLYHLALTESGRDSSEEDGFNFYPIYERFADRIKNADIAYINQEVMMDDDKKYSNYPNFNTAEALGDDLYALGFDIVGIGNNHTLDTGCSGARSTIEKFDSLGMMTVGAYKNAQDEKNIRVIEKNGIKIAFLSYTYPGFNGHSFTNDNCGLTIPTIDDNKMLADLKAANSIADFTVVFVHWGEENSFTPSSEQKRVAKLLANGGAGIIIGTHPHVLQPIEWIETDNSKPVLCAYSLGNFISMMAKDYNMLGGIFEFDVVKCGDDVTVENAMLSPTVFYFNMSYGDCKVMPLEEFTTEMSKTHGVRLYPKDSSIKNTISPESVTGYYKKYIAESFRPEIFK